ncbi:hypothetical protein C5N14_23090 [Micromonospora sp. MW-13]|nr:hypothetical protein C5N14_23090 [Micromonospora sp. MW-13]
MGLGLGSPWMGAAPSDGAPAGRVVTPVRCRPAAAGDAVTRVTVTRASGAADGMRPP